MQNDVNTEKLLQTLGLCAKARKLISGTPIICDALKKGKQKIYLVITASDNSENTAKRLSDRCTYYGVRLYSLSADGEALAHVIGKNGRVAAVAVTDENLCRLAEKFLEEHQK